MRHSTCHPDRPHKAHNLCKSCWTTRRHRKLKETNDPRYYRLLEQWDASRKKYRERNKERIRIHTTAHRYGLSEDAVRALEQAACAICDAKPRRGHKMHVDHDHETGKVRGRLCAACNVLTGHMNKYPWKVAAILSYLAIHKEKSA